MKKGDTVDIYNMTLSGKPFKEGKAKLLEKLIDNEEQEYWRVIFPGEGETPVQRWIDKERKEQ